MTEPTPEVPATEEPTAPETKKGRPRPDDTKARDERVLEIVAGAGTAGITRQGVATALGEDVKASHAYLSLFRLHRDQKVQRVRVDGKHAWVTTENVPAEPAPVA